MPDPFAGRHAELAAGLAAGAVAALLCLAVWALRRRRRPGVPVPVAGAGLAAALAVAGLLAWGALAGGAGGPGSWAGALACLGVLATEPLASRLDRRGGRDGGGPGRAGLLGAHLLLVAVAARVV